MGGGRRDEGKVAGGREYRVKGECARCTQQCTLYFKTTLVLVLEFFHVHTPTLILAAADKCRGHAFID